ncbi:hypothetical protein [Caulifigura coniformis]|nr:hypothetical protein [Caulifigura coniformis]
MAPISAGPDAGSSANPDAVSAAPAVGNVADGLNEAQQFAPAILGSIRTNSERLQAVELALTRTFQDAGVTKETTVEEPLPNGGMIVVTKKPMATYVERVVIFEDRLRIDQGGTAGAPPAITYWGDGARWTESNVSARRIAKMHAHQLGGRTLDPRESAGLDLRTSLANMLAQAALKNATITTNGSVSTISTATNPGGQKLIVDFDSNFSMLPTRSQLFHLNGALVRDLRMTYSRIAERDAWAIQSITERIYDENVDGLATPDKWKQQLVTTAVCTVLDRDAADKLLSPTVPEGYRVIDYTDEATMRRKSPPMSMVAATTGSPWKWFLAAHVVVIAAAVAIYYLRRRRTSPVRTY